MCLAQGLIYSKHIGVLNCMIIGTSLVVQWLRLHTSSAGDAGPILGQELRSHMPRSAAKKKNYMFIISFPRDKV